MVQLWITSVTLFANRLESCFLLSVLRDLVVWNVLFAPQAMESGIGRWWWVCRKTCLSTLWTMVTAWKLKRTTFDPLQPDSWLYPFRLFAAGSQVCVCVMEGESVNFSYWNILRPFFKLTAFLFSHQEILFVFFCIVVYLGIPDWNYGITSRITRSLAYSAMGWFMFLAQIEIIRL